MKIHDRKTQVCHCSRLNLCQEDEDENGEKNPYKDMYLNLCSRMELTDKKTLY